MLRPTLAAVLIALAPAVASAASIPLVQGARWEVGATSAGRFARDSAALLETMGKQSMSLSAKHVGQQIRRRYALPLVDTSALKDAGVDLGQPWIMFERGGARYLACSVSDAHAFTRSLDAWAESRGLRLDTATQGLIGAFSASFSHSPGSRPSVGYCIKNKQALILLQPAERTPALLETLAKVESAAPVVPPVDGSLLVWAGQTIRSDAAKDVWLAFTARPDGIDLAGSARKIGDGWLVRDAKKSEWIRSLTGFVDSVGEPPAWARMVAGPKQTENLVASLFDTADEKLAGWITALSALGSGPVEAVARTLDMDTLSTANFSNIRPTLLLATQPEVLVEDRSPDAIAARIAGLAAACGATPDGDIVKAHCPDASVTASGKDRTLGIGLGNNTPPPEAPAVIYSTVPHGSPALACAKGIPVASARMSFRTLADRTKGIGFMDALSSEALAGAYAIGLEYGGLLRASQPAVGLMCLDGSGRLSIQGRWRIAVKE